MVLEHGREHDSQWAAISFGGVRRIVGSAMNPRRSSFRSGQRL